MCFTETKLDDSANPAAPNIPGALSLESGRMNVVWIKEEQLLFLPNMSVAHFTSWQHICFRQGFIYNSPEQKKEQRKWRGKEPTQLTNVFVKTQHVYKKPLIVEQLKAY